MEVYHTGMPVWGIFVAFGMAIVYIIPVGTVYAVANLNANVLTVLGEIISGYLLPGKPIVMLIFKVSAATLNNSNHQEIKNAHPLIPS